MNTKNEMPNAKRQRQQKGITLIALVITVIVLLILAGTAISIAVNGNNIFAKANTAVNMYNDRVGQQETNLIALNTQFDNYYNQYQNGENGNTETPISKDPTEDGFVGYYADVDGDDDIDGIIYVDLLVGKPVSPWQGEVDYGGDGLYVLPTDVTASNVKDYVVSETAVTDARFDSIARYVISPASSTQGTKDRFYVMGLEDITDGENDTLYWYYSAYSYNNYAGMEDYATYTSEAFGKGSENTTKMLTKWNAEGYGTKNDMDLWKWIDVGTGGANEGWFVPSADEWRAFGDAFGIHGDVYDENWENIISAANYTSFGLSDSYWSSSQAYATSGAYGAYLGGGYIVGNDVNGSRYYVRLSTTF